MARVLGKPIPTMTSVRSTDDLPDDPIARAVVALDYHGGRAELSRRGRTFDDYINGRIQGFTPALLEAAMPAVDSLGPDPHIEKKSVKYSEDQPREHGRFSTAGGEGEPSRELGHLVAKDYAGEVGNNRQTTRVETGTIPTSMVAHLAGANGEIPGQHADTQGARWDQLVADVKENGVKQPISISVDHGGQPLISEGNARRDAALEANIKSVPVQIEYHGHAEQEGTVVQRALNDPYHPR